MNRRGFLHHAIAGGAAATLVASRPRRAEGAAVRWPIGCFNRPWTAWSFDEALRQIKAAGYETTGLLTTTKDEPFIGAGATPEYLTRLKQRIAGSGLTATMGALRSRHDIPLSDAITDVRTQIDHAATLGLADVLSFGVDAPEQYEHYSKVMSDAAAYAAERRIRLVMKPHGGTSGAADEKTLSSTADRRRMMASQSQRSVGDAPCRSPCRRRIGRRGRRHRRRPDLP